MDIRLQKKSPVEGTIIIQVQESDYISIVEEKLQEYSKNSPMKGFRPGHIPLSLIKKIHGANIVRETISTLVSKCLTNYLQEGDINIIGEPLPEEEVMQKIDWARQREFELQYSIGLVEETDLVLSKDWQVTAYTIGQIADETIDDIIQVISKAKGEKQEVDQSAIGDMIYGELSDQQQRLFKDICFSLEKSKAEAGKALLNLQATDKITLDINELLQQGIRPLGLTDKVLQELIEREGPFEFTVVKIERLIPAEINQALFDKLLGEDVVNSLEEFRSKLREYVILKMQQEADELLRISIKNVLLAHIPINLPEDFLKRWLRYNNPDLKTEEDLEASYQYHAQDLSWELIIKKVIETYGLQVSSDAILEETKWYFQRVYEIPDRVLDWLAKIFLLENECDNYIWMLRNLILNKVFDCIKEQITIVTQDVTVEEFDKLP